MANGNQMLAATVCILFFVGFVVYSNNEDHRPAHLQEGSPSKEIEDAYNAELRTLTANITSAKATRGLAMIEIQQGRLPGDADTAGIGPPGFRRDDCLCPEGNIRADAR